MGTAIVSLTRQPIMIQQKQKISEKENPRVRDIFLPIKTEEEFAAYIEAGEKGPFTDYNVVLKELRDRYGI